MTLNTEKLTWKIHELIRGQSYNFRVFAHNKIGRGPAAMLESEVTALDPISPPSSPEELRYSNPTSRSIILTWKRPSSDGGCFLTGYRVELCEKGSENWICDASEFPNTEYQVEKLTPEIEYQYRVFAQNKAGISKPAVLPLVVAKDPIGKNGCHHSCPITSVYNIIKS